MAQPANSPSAVLEFENASPDAVHVFLQIGGTPFYLSRVDQLKRARLRLPLSNPVQLRIIVVPAGELGTFRGSAAERGGFSTEVINLHDLTVQQWRFTGSLVLATGPTRVPR